MSEQIEKLRGKVVIVTGGTGGIGAAVCEAIAAEGASVIVADVNADRIDGVVTRLKQRSPNVKPSGFKMDVRLEADNAALVKTTLDRYGRIDALIACAGILRAGGESLKTIIDVSLDEWNQVLDVNLKGVFLSNRAVLPTMIQQRSGVIVNISSVQGLVGRAHDGPYCASKFGVIGLSQAIAEEVKSFGVKVTTIMPHAIDTPMWDQNGPIPKPGNALPPARIADVIVFMLSQPEDTVLTGVVVAPLGARMRKKTPDEAKKLS